MLRTSAIILGLTLLILGSGTYAIFHDTETSQGNYIEAGTLDLVLTNTYESADARWTLSNAKPGDKVPSNTVSGSTGTLRIYNNGSIEADHVEIGFSACYIDTPDVESDTNDTGIGNWLEEIVVISMTYTNYGGSPIYLVSYDLSGYSYDSNYVSDLDNDGFITLADLVKQTIDNLPAPPAINGAAPDGAHYAQFDMILQINNTHYPQNDWQGDTLYITVHVALAQDSSQDVLQPSPTVEQCPIAIS